MSEESNTTPNVIDNTLSAEAREQIQSVLTPGEELKVAVEGDLELPGRFGATWLVATNERLLSLVPNGGTPHITAELPLSQARAVRKRDLLNSGILEVETEEQAMPLLRFTHARSEAVNTALNSIRKLLPCAPEEGEERKRGGRGGGDWQSRRKRELCPKCGKPMARWMSVCLDCLDRRGLITRLIARAKPYWVPLSASFVMMFITIGLTNFPPILQKHLIDDVLWNRHGSARDLRLHTLFVIMVALLGIRISLAVISAVSGFLMNWLGEKITLDLRTEIYNHLQKLSLSYYDQKESGWIMDRIWSDSSNIQDFLTNSIQNTASNILNLVVIAGIMFWFNWRLALLSLFPAPIIVMLSAYYMKRTHKLYHRQWRRRSRLFGLLANVIPGVRVVKAFAQEEREQGRFLDGSRELMGSSIQTFRTQRSFTLSNNFVTMLSALAMWGYGGYLVVTGAPHATVGTLVMFMSYVMMFYTPLQSLAQMSQQVQRAATAAQRVFEVLDAQPDVPEMHDAQELPQIEGAVEFKNVTFGYDPHTMVLKDVSFKVEPGEMIGLVGPSGAGKSTTINLLCRFYDVTEGTIEIDGVDIRDVSLRSLRDQIGVVLQEPFLFHGTIAENIAYGNPGATSEDVIRAAKAANAHEFILRFPDGYDTLAGERGTRLSGGERQRISIARAILKNPRILILDEATASVDTETEEQIREAIDRLITGRTTFAIAHRFSTLQHANRLIVLDKGRLMEIGTHEELLAKEDGIFRRLCDKQAEMSKIVMVGG